MQPIVPSAYDRAITVFSPDGRLFQVEYAKEAVRRGATAIALIAKDAIVFIAHKTKTSKLIVPESLKKIYEIDEHIGAIASGMAADAARLIDYARIEAQKYRYTYSEPCDADYIAKEVAEVMQLYTQYGGARPFGVSFVFGGINKNKSLFEIDPSGSITGVYATAIGVGRDEVLKFFEKEYERDISMDDAIILGFRALKNVPDLKLKVDYFDVGIIREETKKFELLPNEKVLQYIQKV
ncbi:MAG: archaeal proteasome endopeptidase complex subunit alpha [Candidatus Micrarchaeia archaeon]